MIDIEDALSDGWRSCEVTEISQYEAFEMRKDSYFMEPFNYPRYVDIKVGEVGALFEIRSDCVWPTMRFIVKV